MALFLAGVTGEVCDLVNGEFSERSYVAWPWARCIIHAHMVRVHVYVRMQGLAGWLAEAGQPSLLG